MSDLEHAREAKRVLADRFRDDARVVGIGLGRRGGDYVVRVRLREEVGPDTVPATIRVDSAAVDVAVHAEVVGSIHPQD